MIDERFSREAFERLRERPDELRELSAQLCAAVTARLHPLLVTAMEEIVLELNARGHSLQPYGERRQGVVALRDGGPPDGPVAQLRLAHDSVVSVGYGDFDPRTT